MNNPAFYSKANSNPMESKIDNKLVVVSGTNDGQEFPLLEGRTTIGSAPPNDVLLGDKNVSGFHAEVRLKNDAWYISDFNSEKGTFLNGKRVTGETQFKAGDRLQIGSTNTVFIPLNAILAKKNIGMKDSKDVPKTFALVKHKKWLLTGCVIVLMLCAMKMVPTVHGNREVENSQVEHRAPQATAPSVGKQASASDTDNVHKYEAGSTNEGPDAVNGRQDPSSKKSAPHDKIANVNFKIANKFADYQLWNEALEHYRRVSEKGSDSPGLSEQIAKMQFEIGSKTAFGQGMGLIKLGRYERGIAILKSIKEKSYYYPIAAEEIDKAEKQMTKAPKMQPLG